MGGYLYGTLYLLVLIAAYRKTKQWVTTTPPDELAGKAPRFIIPNPPKDTDGRREESGRGMRELQGK